jgi:hypothetical protein
MSLAREKGDSHLLPVAEGDTAAAAGRGLETKGGCHLFRLPPPSMMPLPSVHFVRSRLGVT